MADVDKLTLEIEDKSSDATEGIDSLIDKLYELDKIMSHSSSNLKKLSSSFGGLAQASKDLGDKVSGGNKASKGIGQRFGGATELLSSTILLKKAGEAVGYLLKQSNDFIETQNLFNVVMGESAEKAEQFIDALEMIGVNQEQAMRYQSSFYDIAKSMGLTTQNAYTLSEQFTKLAYDYSSLYNMAENDAFTKLQSAITGEIEPIRRLGKDISEARLQQIAYNLGINESVRQMDQASKAELRFIAVMQQSKAAMNDMERTINSPANALRVLKAQFISLARELGNIFIPVLQAVLPWLIAITKILRGIVSNIASFFGISMKQIDFGGINSQLGVSSDLTNNVGDNLKKSADNAKKLKDYMLGIDELNVLNADTGTVDRNTGGSVGVGGGGSGLGVNLEDFGYDEVLKDVQARADEILKIFEKWKPVLLTIAGILGTLWTVGKITNFVRAMNGVQSTSTMLAGTQGLKALANTFFGLAGGSGPIALASTALVNLGDKMLFAMGITTGSVTLAGLTSLGTILGGVAIAAWGVAEAMKPAVKQVDEFRYVSETTKSKLEPLIETWKTLDEELTRMDWSNKVITEEDVRSITDKTHQMVESVLNEVSADRNQALKDIEMLKGIESISPETYQKMMDDTTTYYNDIQKSTQEAENEINSILSNASNEKRGLKSEEVARLKELEQQIRDNAVDTMTESEQEQMLILTRLKHNQEALQVETASKMLKEAKKNYDDQVAEAEDWKTRMLMELDQRFADEESKSSEAYKEQKQAIQKAYEAQRKEAAEGYDAITKEVKRGLGDQQSAIDYATGEIKSNWETWLGDISKAWDDTWNGLKTWYQNTIDNMRKWWDGIGSAFDEWKKDMGKKWDKFWGGLGTKQGNIKEPNPWISRSISNVPIDYTVGSVATPKIAAFARGGFVPNNAKFIPPTSLWTAGEAGREIVGKFNGRTTVMPLEDTGFVQAMYRAVYQAVKDTAGDKTINITIHPQVKIGNKDIKQAQEEYEFDSGGSLIRRK